MVVSSARFMRSLKEGVLDPEVYHLNPKASDTDSFRRFVRWASLHISTDGSLCV